MPKPVCVKCQRFFRCRKSGFYFTEGKPRGNNVLPGTADPERWEPYKVWSSDRWECEGCGTVILCGFGSQSITEDFRPDFEDVRRKLQADQFQVNDC